MGDLADVFIETRGTITELVLGLSEDELNRAVPATPIWTIKDVVAHLTGDVSSVSEGDYPSAFFSALGEPEAVKVLNEWTAGHVAVRKDNSIEDIVAEWDKHTETVTSMMRGEIAWPEGVPGEIAGRVLLTDLTVHQQDIYGALDIVRGREALPIKMGLGGYIAVMDLRLRTQGGPGLTIEAPDKSWTVGADEPSATLRVPSRWELFRAMSGRRSVEQLKSNGWTHDAEAFIPFFYLYGVRKERLAE